jgi:hypothetical protein
MRFFPSPQIPWKSIPKELRPPRLVTINVPSKVRLSRVNVKNAPFGVQQALIKSVVGDNGISSFINPLQKLVFNYCDFGGSSNGIRFSFFLLLIV